MPPEPTAPRRPNYLDLPTLAALVRDHRRTGVVSDALGVALLAIARGVWDRYRFTPDADDFAQEVVVHLLGRPLEKCDPSKHLFNYFTTCAIRYGQKLRDKANGDRRRFEAYARDLADSGVPIPAAESGADPADPD